MTGLRLRDLDAAWIEAQRNDMQYAFWGDDLSKKRHLQMLDVLAVALPALKEHAGVCASCCGIYIHRRDCLICDGTGSNPARRALNTIIDTGDQA